MTYLFLSIIALPWILIRHNKHKRSLLYEIFFCVGILILILFTISAATAMFTTQQGTYTLAFLAGLAFLVIAINRDNKRHQTPKLIE